MFGYELDEFVTVNYRWDQEISCPRESDECQNDLDKGLSEGLGFCHHHDHRRIDYSP
jgi:hypothetical protein